MRKYLYFAVSFLILWILIFIGGFGRTELYNGEFSEFAFVSAFLLTILATFESRKVELIPSKITRMLVVVMSCIYATTVYFNIRTASFFSAELVGFTLIIALCGWRIAVLFIPAAIALILSLPNASYIIDKLFDSQESLRMASIVACIVWGIANAFTSKLLPKAHNFAFLLCVASVICYINVESEDSKFIALKVGDCLNLKKFQMTIPKPTSKESAMFPTNYARWSYFRKENGATISALIVDIFGELREIHPVDNCVRCIGRRIVDMSERIVYLPRGTMGIQEILERDESGIYTLHWIWYSNERISTPRFLRFRILYDSKSNWQYVQLAVKVNAYNIVERRDQLTALLREIDSQDMN